MNNEIGDLFALTRRDDHDTSIRAAEFIADSLGKTRGQVYRTLLAAGERGMTDTELRLECERQFGIRAESTYRKRRSELPQLGLALDTGVRRENTGGQNEAVHVGLLPTEASYLMQRLREADDKKRKSVISQFLKGGDLAEF